MTNAQWLELLKQNKVIAVVRCGEMDLAYQMALAAAAGGMRLIEITCNSDRPEYLISKLREELPHCTIGVGTVLTLTQLTQAVGAGAQFAFAPHCNHQLLAAANQHQIPLVPGAFSPTEIVHAWQQGAAAVKVFPIKSLGGAEYIKCLQAPLGQIPLIPTGGITLANAPLMIKAGAIAVGISSDLFAKEAISQRDWQCITSKSITMLAELNSLEQ